MARDGEGESEPGVARVVSPSVVAQPLCFVADTSTRTTGVVGAADEATFFVTLLCAVSVLGVRRRSVVVATIA